MVKINRVNFREFVKLYNNNHFKDDSIGKAFIDYFKLEDTNKLSEKDGQEAVNAIYATVQIVPFTFEYFKLK